MSDAMTNREIEDVLTSIRRLVAQEGGRGAEIGRLILTEAQRINAPAADAPPTLDAAGAGDAGDAGDPVGPVVANDDCDDDSHVSIPAPDFGKLEATIAELEAAVSASDYEGETGDEAPRASNVTELYGRLSFVHRGADAPATEVAEAAPVAPQPQAAPEPVVETADAAEVAAYVEPAPNDAEPEAPAGPEGAPDEAEAVIDEETLRLLIAQIVREELHGQLGERITQQVRKLVRAEIAKALDEHNLL
ncbi:MAG: hypothetical protein KDK12_04625 [Rhodobacteraceae bacterium]|nr:hypothetical protein [Paracoccaceae bacterium]